MDAVERRQQILELLCQRRKDTMQNLAAELGVSERTIRRDVEILTRSYHTIKIVLEQAWDETIEVSPAWDETVTTGYSCSCGAVK